MNSQETAVASAKQAAPEEYLLEIAFSALRSQALYVAAKLGIADLLASGPRSVQELAAETKTNERALYRVLRTLVSADVFQELEGEVFALNSTAQPLQTGVVNSLRNGLIFMGEEWHWRVWGNLLASVGTGKPSWKKVHGAEVFDYFADHSEEAEIFNRAMTDISAGVAPAVVEAYDFSEVRVLADIAGGHGLLLAKILKANPDAKGILFDVPSVIEGAGKVLETEGVKARVRTVAGDFFKSVPAGADTYIMKHIIHDWDDEHSLRILRNINAVSLPKTKVLLVESVVPEDSRPHYSKLLDLEMLVSPGGVERTTEEYRRLFAAAGFRLTRIVPTRSAYSVIEAVKE